MTTVLTRLIDGEQMNADHPATFLIPDEAERNRLMPGDYAKIGITSKEGGERFWVKITERRTEQDRCLYAGAVSNDLVIFDIPLGEIIEFDPANVLEIIEVKGGVA